MRHDFCSSHPIKAFGGYGKGMQPYSFMRQSIPTPSLQSYLFFGEQKGSKNGESFGWVWVMKSKCENKVLAGNFPRTDESRDEMD